ncbi:hypothetical protein CRG98_031149 [Punica granatum]|uniref:Uncharacterized protein n=1 Tax=Punica granatum TaxID=22663 RepID=A0A2I0IXR5_PUNGR|nr:hypothetical protein CRG98_031149 [Punica granatum]
MLGRSPKAVNAGPGPDAGSKPKSVAEAQKWGRSPMRGRNPKVNAGLEPDAGPKPDAEPKPNAVNACSIRKCKRCKSKGEDRGWFTREGWHNSLVVRGGWPAWTASGHSTSRHGEVKTAGDLPAKVSTTHLSCEVGGRDGRPLVIAGLTMESVLLGKPLTRDGGSRFKGVNSLKSSEDLWEPVRWQSLLDAFPYSEPLTNLAS